MHVLVNQCVFIMIFSFIHPPIYSQWTPLIWLGFVLICRGLRGVNLCIIIYVYIYTTHILCNAHAHVYMCVHVCNVGVHVCNVGVHVCNVGVHALEEIPGSDKKSVGLNERWFFFCLYIYISSCMYLCMYGSIHWFLFSLLHWFIYIFTIGPIHMPSLCIDL